MRTEKWWFGGFVTIVVGLATVATTLYVHKQQQQFDERKHQFERDLRQRELELEVERADVQRTTAERDRLRESSAAAVQEFKDVVTKLVHEQCQLSVAEQQEVRRDVQTIQEKIEPKAPTCGDAEACNQMGLELSVKAQTEHSPAAHVEALRFFDRSCELGDLAGCVNQAGILVRGPCEIQDHVRARELFKKACAQRRKTACSSLAALYWKGQGGEPDFVQARKFAQRACELGDPDGCDIVTDITRGRLNAPVAGALKGDGPKCSPN